LTGQRQQGHKTFQLVLRGLVFKTNGPEKKSNGNHLTHFHLEWPSIQYCVWTM